MKDKEEPGTSKDRHKRLLRRMAENIKGLERGKVKDATEGQQEVVFNVPPRQKQWLRTSREYLQGEAE